VASGNISRNMQVVREISTQTADSSAATSTSIGKLAALAAQLRKSVAGFRLPDFGGGTTTLSAASSTRLPALKEPVNAGSGNPAGGKSPPVRKVSGLGA
jgi:twitching motility protein PilJ